MNPNEVQIERILKAYFLCEDNIGDKYIIDYNCTRPTEASIGISREYGTLETKMKFESFVQAMNMTRVDDEDISSDSEALDDFLKEFIRSEYV